MPDKQSPQEVNDFEDIDFGPDPYALADHEIFDLNFLPPHDLSWFDRLIEEMYKGAANK